MNRQKLTLLALAAVVVTMSGVVAAQAPKPAQPSQAPAARPRLAPPVRGIAQLGYTKPDVKGAKDSIVTTFRIKNLEAGSIIGLKVEELWYDKGGSLIAGSEYRHPKPLQPGEVATVTLQIRRDPKMDRNQYSFTHANGMIKVLLQPKL